MAAVTTAEEVRRRNCRLEAFLKRTLDVDSYERIRAHDACIVCSEKDKRAFKFVIISDEWIYLSENPPKKLSPVIHFRDLVSISLASDLAEFLSGQEQENAQHIIIKYKTADLKESARKNNALETERTTQILDQLVLTARALKSNRPDALSFTAKHGYIRTKALTSRNTTRRVTFDMDPEVNKNASSSAKDSSTGKPSPDQPNEGVNKISEKPEKRVTRNLVQKRKKRSKSPSRSMDEEILRDALSKKNDAMTKNDQVVTGNVTGRKKGKKKSKKVENGLESSAVEEDADRSQNLDLNLSGVTGDDSLQVPRLDLSSLDQSFTPRSILRSPIRADLTEDDALSEDAGTREATFHLYILDNRSKILVYMQSAWESYNIRATLEEDAGFLTRRELFPPRDGPGASQKLENLFNQLKSELALPNNTIEEVFLLVRELKNGAERNFALRRFFWKTSEMFLFFIGQLKKYLPGSVSVGETEETTLSRADEIELILVIFETLTLMFRETEIFAARNQHLKDREGAALRDLLYLATCEPKLSKDKASVSFELLELNEEITAKATGVMFELITLAGQNFLGEADGSFVSIPWIMDKLESHGTLLSFTEKVVQQALAIIHPGDLEELSPEESMLLHQQFHVLAALTKYSHDALSFVQEKFYEEFKYYVHMTVIERKLPNRYLIRPYVLQTIETVISRILHKSQTSRSLPTPKRLQQFISRS